MLTLVQTLPLNAKGVASQTKKKHLGNINTLLNFHMFAHAHCTKLSHVCTKNWRNQIAVTFHDYPFVSPATILEFHNKWLLFLNHHCICFLNISSKSFKTLQLLRSSGCYHLISATVRQTDTETDTQTDYYNPPPTLGLKNVKPVGASLYELS